MFWSIAGWVVWGLVALLSLCCFLPGSRDGGVRFMMRTNGFVLALGLIAIAALPISKLHILWVVPVAFVTPMFVMSARAATLSRRLDALRDESRPAIDADNGPAPLERVATSDARLSLHAKTPAEATRAELVAELHRMERESKLLEDPDTICTFGQMAYDGDGVEQDYVAAASWYRIAAEAGNARAQHNLSLMYEKGLGVPQDSSEAARWCRLAARQGHAGSQNNLAVRYEAGDGVARDSAEAYRWYVRAAANGDPNARENLTRLPEGIRTRMEQLVREEDELLLRLAAQERASGDAANSRGRAPS